VCTFRGLTCFILHNRNITVIPARFLAATLSQSTPSLLADLRYARQNHRITTEQDTRYKFRLQKDARAPKPCRMRA
jgi:hypothetical protein